MKVCREESANYFDKYQDLSYNMDTMKAIEHEEESILEECRRIRQELYEEELKDPKKYRENIYKEQEEMEAQGVKFRTKPFVRTKREEALLEEHSKRLDAERAHSRK
ncbi:MAG: hypothetical protein HAW61_01150 [Candidatus Portiera sp.]|nr:hypothetical protein [Portiera sp.]